ncbi:MAG: radical SAM protein [Candidatus Omnitrophica bacterium]|nr:radical SAM protein [Candidatus Omnitrophota bacterium]
MNNHFHKEWSNLKEKMGFYFGRLISYPLVPPEHVYFSITNRCNLRCQMCDISKDPSSEENELSTNRIKDIISQIRDMNVKHLIFSGGEPFLRNDLLKLVEFAVLNNIKMVDIISNGTLLKDDIIERLIKIKLNHITVSLDGLSATNDKIRGKGTFKRSEANIDRLNYYKSKYNSSFPTLGINFTVMNENIDDMLPMVEFARSKKCNIIVFQPVLFNNTKMYQKKTSPLWPSETNIEKLKGIIKEVVKLKEEIKDLCIYTDAAILGAFPDYFEGKRMKNNFKCYEGIKRIVITCDGRLWSCLNIYGNLKIKRLKAIWLSFAAYKMRNRVKKCREHCLQDCIYFPLDIINELKICIQRIKNNR